MAPKTHWWRRPYCAIYNDNYKFGNSLYAPAIHGIERKYQEAIGKVVFRGDRPDLHFQSFASIPTGSRPGSPCTPSSVPSDPLPLTLSRPVSLPGSEEDLDRIKTAFSESLPSRSSPSKMMREEMDAVEERLAEMRRRRRIRRSDTMNQIFRESCLEPIVDEAPMEVVPSGKSMLERCIKYRFHWEVI